MDVTEHLRELDDYRQIKCDSTDSTETFREWFADDTNLSLKIVHLNIRSFRKNFDEFVVVLNELKVDFDIIVLGETWHGDNEVTEQIDGYNVYYTVNNVNRNSGLILYARRDLGETCRRVTLGQANCLQVDFVVGRRHFNVLAVYRSPSADCDGFIDGLYMYYEGRKYRNRTHILIGDTNVDIRAQRENVLKDKYLDCLCSANLTPCIEHATRVTAESATCIDHCFTDHYDHRAVTAAILSTELTDHYTIALRINLGTTSAVAEARTLSYVDLALWGELLRAETWDRVLHEWDVDNATEIFINKINEAKIKATKSKKESTRLKKLKPWINCELITKIRSRDKLSKLVKKRPFDPNVIRKFKNCRKTLQNELRRAKVAYYRSRIQDSAKNSKLFWSTINDITGLSKNKNQFRVNDFLKGNECSEVSITHLANSFNSFFAEVGFNMASNISFSGPTIIDDVDDTPECALELRPVVEEEVLRYVRDMRGGSAPGIDGITASVLKGNIYSLIAPLTHIINISIMGGIFPKSFKTAKVIPLHKTGDKSDFNNYRPISLLSVCDKILEKCIKVQLQQYLEENSLIYKSQFGFRSGINSSDAFFELNKCLVEIVNKNEKAALCFIDLAKAFDSIDREKLFYKLECIGVRGYSLAWFKSYLSDRQQVTCVSGEYSDSKRVEYGVIQGSTLGPLLFLIYINNLSRVQMSGKLFLFADDTAVLFEGRTWEDVFETATSEIMLLKAWFDQNLLSMNTNKTKFMPIALRQESEPPHELSLKLHSCGDVNCKDCDCYTIEKVDNYKYLGVIFDSRLKWDKHIVYVKNKLRKMVYAFSRLQHILNKKEFKIVYCAHIESVLRYGILAWGGAYKTHVESLLVTQKTIIKIGLNKNRRYNSNMLFNEMGVLTVRKLYIKTLLMFTFTRNPITFLTNVHQYQTRLATTFNPRVPKVHKTMNMTNSYFLVSILYRNLPLEYKFTAMRPSTYKALINRWLLDLGNEEAEALISSVYR